MGALKKKKKGRARRAGKKARAGRGELRKLAKKVQDEARSLEGTHPKLVEAVNELCVTLSRLGI